MEVRITENNFEKEVVNCDKNVLVDFWATWCGPCKMIAPELSKVADQLKDVVKVGKVNVDEELGLAMKYRVEVIPTLILFANGEEIKRHTGYLTAEEIIQTFGL